MTVSLVGAVQSNADSTAGWTGGGLEGELSYQGAGSYGGKAGTGTTRYTHAGTARNFNGANAGEHIIVILGSLTPGKLDTKANGGLAIIAGNDTTNYGEWYVDGSDTKSPTSLFLPYIVDPASDFSGAFGTFTTTGNPAQLSAADTFGGRFDATSGIMGNFNNALVDQITIGTGLQGTGTGGSLSEWVTADEGTTANRYGFLTTREGVAYMQGKMYFGTPGTSYVFSDTDKVIIFPDVPVAADFFEIIVENASSVVTFDGFTIQAPGTPKVALTYTSGVWNIDNSTIDGARIISGGAGLTLGGTKITNSGTITQNGASLLNSSILNSTDTTALVMDDEAKVTGVAFEGNNIAIDATAAIVGGEVNIDGCTFSGNTTDITVSSSSDIAINMLNGSNATTCTNTGSGTCSIQNAVTVSIEGIVAGSRLYIVAAATVGSVANGDVLVSEVITADPFTYSHNYEGDLPISYRIRKSSASPYYRPVQSSGTITSAGFSATINQISDE